MSRVEKINRRRGSMSKAQDKPKGLKGRRYLVGEDGFPFQNSSGVGKGGAITN